MKFEDLENLPLEHPMWSIRQALIDMASNLDTEYVNGSFARWAEIGYVESYIEELIEYITKEKDDVL